MKRINNFFIGTLILGNTLIGCSNQKYLLDKTSQEKNFEASNISPQDYFNEANKWVELSRIYNKALDEKNYISDSTFMKISTEYHLQKEKVEKYKVLMKINKRMN